MQHRDKKGLLELKCDSDDTYYETRETAKVTDLLSHRLFNQPFHFKKKNTTMNRIQNCIAVALMYSESTQESEFPLNFYSASRRFAF